MVRAAVISLSLGALLSADFGGLSADPLHEPAPVLVHPQSSPLYSAVITENKSVVAVGSRGVVVLNQDDHWRQIPFPIRRTLTTVIDALNGRLLILGHDALILSGTVNSSSFEVVYSDPEFDAPLLDAWMSESGRGLAIGAYGLALKTNDFGRSWKRIDIDLDEPHFNAIHQSSDGTLFIAGEFGTVLRSSDLGASWERLDVGFESTIWGMESDANGRILLYGILGWLAISEDFGATWTHLKEITNSSIFDAVFLEDGRALLAGAGGTILLESETGSNDFHKFKNARMGTITKILLTSSDTLSVFGEDGVYALDLADSVNE